MNEKYITILSNLIPIFIFLGLVASLYDRNKKIKKIKEIIKNEPVKYNYSYKNITIYSDSNSIYCRIIIALIGVLLCIMILLFFLKIKSYYIISVFVILLYLELIELSPYHIRIEEGNLYYRHLVNTLNKTIIIPIEIIDNISYTDYSKREKNLSININFDLLININLSLVKNSNDIIYELYSYIKYRKKNKSVNYTIENKNIKIGLSYGYIFIFLELLIFEFVTIYSMFNGYQDIITILCASILPVIATLIFPYKIWCENDILKYKHFWYTQNKEISINIYQIDSISIITEKRRYDTFYIHKLVIKYKYDLYVVPLYFKNIVDAVKLINYIKNKKEWNNKIKN